MAVLPQASDQAVTAKSFQYLSELDPNSDSAPARALRLVGTDKRVLELGGAVGQMSKLLRDRGCQVVSLEIGAPAAALASEFCERVIVGDLDQLDLAQELGDDSFDVILATDVLEHLKDPLATLLKVKQHLRPEGYVVASLTNIAHGSVRLALLGGQFQYAQQGLLDAAHLRFYTRETMEQLFEDAGLVIGHLERVERKIEESEVRWDKAAAPPGLVETLSQDPEALTYQFVIVAYPFARSELRLIRQRMQNLIKAKEEAESRARALAAESEAAQHQLGLLNERHAADERQICDLIERHEAQARRHALAEQELAGLRQVVAEQGEDLQALAQALAAHEAEFRSRLFNVHEQLAHRDDECLRLQTELHQAQDKIQWIEAAKAWRLVNWFWRTRQRVKSFFSS